MVQELFMKSLSIFLSSATMGMFLLLLFLPFDKIAGVKINAMHLIKEHQRYTLILALTNWANSLLTALLCYFIGSFIVRKWYEVVTK